MTYKRTKDLKMINSHTDILFSIIKCLKQYNYKALQYYPTNQAKYFGHELLLLRSFFSKNEISLFRSSAILNIYEKLMYKHNPNLYKLYKFFFCCENISKQTLKIYFTDYEINKLLEHKVIYLRSKKYFSKYKFVPLQDTLIVCSPPCEWDTPNYVHIGLDTVTLWKHLIKEHNRHVNSALEIGCGAGFLSIWLSRFAKYVTSTDISERALQFVQLNARLNNIYNINAVYSDVYSHLKEKYDVIISNPPYLFLPNEYMKRTFGYGGYLGLDIVKKILLDLDIYLNENGVAYILANSYIHENGMNPLYNVVERIFYEKKFSITLKQILFVMPRYLESFYKEEKICKSVLYFMKIRKGFNYKIEHSQLINVSKAIQNFRVKLRL